MSHEEESRMENFIDWLYRRSFLGFPNYRVIATIYVICMFLIIIHLTLLIPPSQFPLDHFLFNLEMLFSVIGVVVIVSRIVKSEKEIKLLTGHYCIFPPQEIYD